MGDECWKRVDWIDGYCGTIEVSDAGRVRVSGRTYPHRKPGGGFTTSRKPDRVLRHYLNRGGYPTIALKLLDGTRPKFFVHRFVARAFVYGYSAGLTVNHINGIKTDNRASNLEWVSLSRNTELQWETGLVDLRGENQPLSKLNADKVREIRNLVLSGAKKTHVAKKMGVCDATIIKICRREAWKHVD